MTTRCIDHTAVAVRDLNEAIERYMRLYGVETVDREVVTDQGVEVAFLRLENTSLELISPLDETSGVARFLQKRGEGLHHVAFLVDSLEDELARFEREGIELIDTQPRTGAHGRIAFLHPRGTGGVLVELVQRDDT